MKKMISVLALLVGFSAFAMPKVNDQATYSLGEVRGGSTVKTGTLTQKIVSFDAAKNTYTVEATLSPISGSPQTETNEMDADEMLDDAQVQGMLQQCAAFGGTRQSVRVGTTNVDTCKISNMGDGTMWLGLVPFGMVRMETTTNVLNLESFTFGR